TRSTRDWSSDVCSSDLGECVELGVGGQELGRVAPQRLVALLELVGALLDTLLKLGGIALQLVLLVLDAAEHLVEGIGQCAQLVQIGRASCRGSGVCTLF